MTHTPGPWGWDYPFNWNNERFGDPAIIIKNENDVEVCSLPYGHTDDATLIFAAPELLAACYKALDGMYDQCPQYETMSNDELNHPDLDCYAVEVILDIRHALAKAEGEQ